MDINSLLAVASGALVGLVFPLLARLVRAWVRFRGSSISTRSGPLDVALLAISLILLSALALYGLANSGVEIRMLPFVVAVAVVYLAVEASTERGTPVPQLKVARN